MDSGLREPMSSAVQLEATEGFHQGLRILERCGSWIPEGGWSPVTRQEAEARTRVEARTENNEGHLLGTKQLQGTREGTWDFRERRHHKEEALPRAKDDSFGWRCNFGMQICLINYKLTKG